MGKSPLAWFLGTLIVLIAASGAGYYYYISNTSSMSATAATPTGSAYSSRRTPTAVLTMSNKDYATAKNYQAGGNYDLALSYYEKALAEAQDNNQAAQIKYNIASMNEKLGNYKDAITQFKAIAADTANYPISRAYAVQEIGLMYYTYYKSADRQTIVAETFKDSPYDSFKNDGNLNMAYTELFGYAAGIYPLADSEARVAYGYSNEILTTLHSATTTAQGKVYLSIITQSLQAADADIARIKDIPTETSFIPDILVREGITTGHLVTLGVADPEQAENYYQKGIQYAAAIGVKPGNFHAFHYAAFLATHYGMARSADIKSILAPFRAGNSAEILPDVVDFYRTSRTDPTLAQERKALVLLGRIDPDFKTYLISLGWKAADF